MNRKKFMDSTRMIVSCLKEYNVKLCRKGLLERGLKMKLYIGDFKNLENKFLKETFNPNGNGNGTELKIKLNGEKEALVLENINKLKTALKALDKTISTLKGEIKSLIRKVNYDAWVNRVDLISSRFKSLYSDLNNDLYNHLYKMSTKIDTVWNNVSTDSEWIIGNICNSYTDVKELVTDFEEDDLNGLFSEEKKQDVDNVTGKLNENKNSKKRKSDPADDLKEKIQKKEPTVKDTRNSEVKNAKNELFDPVSTDESSEDETSIINNAITTDEVGEIDIDDFTHLLYEHIN